MIGKLPAEALQATVLERTGAESDTVLQGPAYGEDTAAIDLGDQTLVVNADPLSLAADQVGRLGIHVVCNDVAASGARPAWVTNTLFLPEDDQSMLETIIEQVDTTAREIGVSIVGGHAEYAAELSRPLLSLSAMGLTDRYIPTGGGSPGDAIILTGGAGVEGTAILATDFRERLRDRAIPEDVLDRAATFLEEISVIPEAMAVRDVASGMHDPTEGGIVAGLHEMAAATGQTFAIERDRIPIREETATLCRAMEVDPLSIFGSGALLLTIPPEDVAGATDALENTASSVAVIGEVVEGEGRVRIDDEELTASPRDELYALWT